MKKTTECLAYLEALEGNKVDSAAFASHLAGCPSCREGLATMRSMKGLKTVYPSTGMEALKNRIREEIARPTTGAAPTGYSGFSVAGAVAVLAVVGMVVAGSLLVSSGHQPSGISGESVSRPSISSAAMMPNLPSAPAPEVSSNSSISTVSVPTPSPDRE